MSRRIFRILSDSEDDGDDTPKATSANDHPVTKGHEQRTDPSDDEDGSTGDVANGAKTVRRRKARLASDDDDDNDDENHQDRHENEHSDQDRASHSSRDRRIETASEANVNLERNATRVREPAGSRNDRNGSSSSSDGEGDSDDSEPNREGRAHRSVEGEGESGEDEHQNHNDDADDNQEGSDCDNQGDNRGDGDQEDENNEEGEGATPGADEAEEAPARTVVKKRIVKNPQPKLDDARLTGERGLGRLRNMHPYIKLKGKGHEREDVRCILHHLQLWGHRMFPRMQMKDILERCERLGSKMSVKIYLRKMRTGQIHDFNAPVLNDDDEVMRGDSEDEQAVGKQNELEESADAGVDGQTMKEDGRDLFEELMASEECNRAKMHHSSQPSETTGSVESAASDTRKQVDEELRLRIEAKRLAAIRKREELRRERERAQMELQNTESPTNPSSSCSDGNNIDDNKTSDRDHNSNHLSNTKPGDRDDNGSNHEDDLALEHQLQMEQMEFDGMEAAS